MAAAKKELDIKRAASASKGAKVFYKVTVKVSARPTLLSPCKGRVMACYEGKSIVWQHCAETCMSQQCSVHTHPAP